MGTVLFDTAINEVQRLSKNYLGRYDDALYFMAGDTDIEDNFYLTRDDGSHFLIQFVRGEADEGANDEIADSDLTRTVDSTSTISLLSPFMLSFTDGSEITVTIFDREIPSDCYVYDSETQSFKLLLGFFDCFEDNYAHMTMRDQRYLDIIVSAADETITLRIEVSPLAYRF
jgi:hypothetical protein